MADGFYFGQGSQPHPGGSQGSAVPGANKDPDTIKLFLGMIPRHLDEAALRPTFERFGEISELVLLRDRASGGYKGCGFLTFVHRQSAVDCINALNDKHTLPGGTAPMQVRPADSEAKGEDRKLFVGMLSFATTEEMLHTMFSRYGTVEETIIIRGPDGQSRGCGFVKYSTRGEALVAIDALNGKVTVEGGRNAIQVKFAETAKDKQQKKLMQMGGGLPFGAIPGGLPGQGIPALGMGLTPQQLFALQQFALMQQGGFPAGFGGFSQQQPAAMMAQLSLGQQFAQPQFAQPAPDVTSAAFTGLQQYAAAGYGQQPYAQQNAYGPAPVRAGRQSNTGPEGANLFVLNLPPDATDDTLRALFAPFGNILSTLVFHDKVTRVSKQFGFVSFDNPTSAAQAIQAMHGFNCNGYALKVSLKKSTAPY